MQHALEAIATLRRLLALQTNVEEQTNTLLQIANIQSGSGQREEARATYVEACSVHPAALAPRPRMRSSSLAKINLTRPKRFSTR
jgi:TolA-binding protein